ncbi:ATP-dependent head maturation protease [Aeromonas phage AerS_266]|nr:ATP-dependent head maturation protease [Aeromonas phage AerS_266]
MSDVQNETPLGNLHTAYVHDTFNAKFITQQFVSIVDIDKIDALKLNISSPGGDIAAAMAAKEILETKPYDIVIVATSRISSACWYLFTGTKCLRLTYANTVWFQHEPAYNLGDREHEELFSVLPHLVAQSQQGHKDIAIASGLPIPDVTRLFDSKTIYLTGMDVLWLGTNGLVDGVIFREVDKSNWIILTREGLKLAHTSDTPKTIKNAPLLSDEFLKEYDLKQFVPVPPKRPTLKTMVAGLDYLTKQELKSV